jgi:hypothetical protein
LSNNSNQGGTQQGNKTQSITQCGAQQFTRGSVSKTAREPP